MRLGPSAVFVVLFCGVAVPLQAQTLEVCNNGTVVVEVVVASEQNHVVYSWVVDGRPVAPGACETVYGHSQPQPAYIGFGFVDAHGQWVAGTMDSLPNLGWRQGWLLQKLPVVSRAEKTLCVHRDKTWYGIGDRLIPSLNCATLQTPKDEGHGPYVPLTAILYFEPSPLQFSSTAGTIGGNYWLTIAPTPTSTELHASSGRMTVANPSAPGPAPVPRPAPVPPPSPRPTVVPTAFDNKEKYGIYLYGRMGHVSDTEASAIYAGMIKVLGKEVVEAAAEKVRTAERKPNDDLVTHVKEPYKVSPDGKKVEDYDVPVPPGVIGVYTNQLVAMEILATEDSDAHYLLYLLKSRFQGNRRLLPQDADKWTYAKNSYDGLTRAFGQAQLQGAAHAVHTATKRLLTGSVMNQQALGATRNEPFEAFEDILARKDPRGYVKAAIAFKENLYSPASVDVETAYRQLIAGSDESKVLEAARTMVAGKPHFLYRDEFDQLKKAIDSR